MNLVVTGGSGMLGRAVMQEFADLQPVGTCFSRPKDNILQVVNLADRDRVIEFLEKSRPNVIVHCAAIRFPDKCQEYSEELRRINVSSAEWIGNWCRENNAYLVHISSDYVFNGTNPPYTPDSETNAVNIYGQTKLDAETQILNTHCRSAILRVPVLYSLNQLNTDESSMTGFLSQVIQQESCQLDDWAIRYPTSVQDVAKAVSVLIQSQHTGIYHFSAQFACTKYSTAVKLCEIKNLDVDKLIRVEGVGAIPRPKDCHLLTSSIFQHISCMNYLELLDKLI